ncbi:hypothetical protein QQ045_022434 [Rhodiola kirilowii]
MREGLRFLRLLCTLSLCSYRFLDYLSYFLTSHYFEDISPVTEAAVRLQPRCSDKSERDSGIVSSTTRMLVPSSRIGCLIGIGGAIISEIRKLTKANIRIPPKGNLPKIAVEDDEMVQISGDLDVAKVAHILASSSLHSWADLPIADRYGSYSSPPQICGVRGNAYAAYGSSYSSGGRSDSPSHDVIFYIVSTVMLTEFPLRPQHREEEAITSCDSYENGRNLRGTSLRSPYIAPSFGGCESIVDQPAIMSYWDLTQAERVSYGIKDSLVRFSFGVEDCEDVKADVLQALDSI